MLKNKGTKLVASAVTILLTIGMIGCGNVESSQEVNLDSTITEVTEASVGNTTIEEETEKASEAISEATVEASTDASSEEVVEAVAETSASKETTETITVEAVANASTNTETVKTSTSGTLTGETGPNGWPIIEYNGSADGKGPGLAWVKGYDYLANENIMGGTYDGVVAFTASNGVTIKAVLYHSPDGQEGYVPIRGDAKGKDLEPNSPWMVAVKEAQATSWAAEDLSANVNATLPNTSYKRNSIDPNDASVVAYKQAYDYKRATVRGGTYYQPNASNVINDSIFFFTDGVGEYDSKGNPLWEFRNNGSYWSLVIYQNPAEYQWSGIKEVLEYLSPDGAALYNVIYTDCYTGSEVIQEWDAWWPVGGSQIYQPNPDAVNRILTYYFN
ncbi:MAG: hypothetical protein IJR29_09450 [Butyrivibrio sp.]|nr:hypothetical protein [Butyrivibrio sp.]